MYKRKTFVVKRNTQSNNDINKSNYNHRRKQKTFSNDVEKGWRDSNDYRKKFFEQNKGIGGRLYFCSQCFKPMVNKSKIHVDHIIPPSRALGKSLLSGKKKKDGLGARLLNNTWNCTAICQSCNSKKGNKISPLYIAKGLTGKSIELGVKATQIALTASLFGTAFVAVNSVKGVFKTLSFLTKRI